MELDAGAGQAQARSMFFTRSPSCLRLHSRLVALIGLAALGCNGIAVGDEGDQGVPPCLTDTTKVPVTDTTATPMGFTESADSLLAPTRETLVGTLKLDDGE